MQAEAALLVRNVAHAHLFIRVLEIILPLSFQLPNPRSKLLDALVRGISLSS